MANNGKHKHLTKQLDKLGDRRRAPHAQGQGRKLPGSMNKHKQR